MVQKVRNIRVRGERREQIDVHRIADLLVRMARRQALELDSGTSDLEVPLERFPEGRRGGNPEQPAR